MKKLDFKIFRFDSKSDYEFYYKPYIYDNCFSSLKELLNQVKKDDIYFDFEDFDDAYVVIDGRYFRLDTSMDEIVQKCSNEFVISPLSTRHARKDLVLNDDEFLSKYDCFYKIFKDDFFDTYKKLKVYYYSSAILPFKYDYIGDSAIVFVYEILKDSLDKRQELLEAISNPQNGIKYYIKNPLFSKAHERVIQIKQMLAQRGLQN